MTDESPHLVGQLISGRYRVLDSIGTGGMGQVYLAEHVAIQKRVALKVLHPTYSSKQDIVERFRQEAISASRIKHPNVLEIFDYGELDNGCSFIAMELLEGRDLGQVLEKEGPLPPAAAIEVLLQICRALEAAHGRGVIHRDLKPDNVFLQKQEDGDPIVKIVDFGIAKLRSNDENPQQQATKRRLTKTGMIFGTPEYMAPEQAQGRPADHRSDIYATGCILFETLTGAVPFTGETFLDVLNRHVLFPVPRIADVNKDVQVSEELESVMQRALAKDPAARFGSMREFADALLAVPEATEVRTSSTALGAWRGGEPAPRQVTQVRGTPLTATSTVLPTKSYRGVWLAATGVGIVTLGLVAWFLRPEDPPMVAEQAAVVEEPEPVAAVEEPAEAPPEPEPQDDPPPAPEPQHVTLQVTTTPEGAVLLKDEFQVCDATPCEVRAEINEPVVLTARLGARSGQAKVLAQRDQKISIALAPAPQRRPAQKKGPEKLCEVMENGLKVLKTCP